MRTQTAALTTSAPALALLSPEQNVELFGVICGYLESATFYVKFFWQGQSSTIPVLGTTVPDLTVPISSGGPGFVLGGTQGVVKRGPLWWAVTANGGTADTTALSTGGEVINFFLG